MNKKGTKKLFFIPEDSVTKDYKINNIAVQFSTEEDDEILDELQNNVDFNDKLELKSINVELKKAKKEQILTQTKVLQQKLEQRKRALFKQWSQNFFQCFSNHFGKLKNIIVELHLNEEQVTKFNQMLDSCLNNMQLNLDSIWNEFNQQNIEEQ